jgi:predicted DNA-binding transcriptional regulator YafY
MSFKVIHDTTPVQFQYKNWRGEVSLRRVRPGRVWYGTTKYYPKPQWLMDAFDLDKGDKRTFALSNISDWKENWMLKEETHDEERQQ